MKKVMYCTGKELFLFNAFPLFGDDIHIVWLQTTFLKAATFQF